MSILADGTQELHSYLFKVRDSISDNSTNLDAIKSALVELLVYLCSPEGRTTDNCTTTDTFFQLHADYGFNCMWLNDDWQGADFIACHIDGNTFLKIQLKGRLTINQKYSSKDIYVTFHQDGQWYLYPHDELRDELLKLGFMIGTKSWDEKGGYSWPKIPKNIFDHMAQYAI